MNIEEMAKRFGANEATIRTAFRKLFGDDYKKYGKEGIREGSSGVGLFFPSDMIAAVEKTIAIRTLNDLDPSRSIKELVAELHIPETTLRRTLRDMPEELQQQAFRGRRGKEVLKDSLYYPPEAVLWLGGDPSVPFVKKDKPKQTEVEETTTEEIVDIIPEEEVEKERPMLTERELLQEVFDRSGGLVLIAIAANKERQRLIVPYESDEESPYQQVLRNIDEGLADIALDLSIRPPLRYRGLSDERVYMITPGTNEDLWDYYMSHKPSKAVQRNWHRFLVDTGDLILQEEFICQRVTGEEKQRLTELVKVSQENADEIFAEIESFRNLPMGPTEYAQANKLDYLDK